MKSLKLQEVSQDEVTRLRIRRKVSNLLMAVVLFLFSTGCLAIMRAGVTDPWIWYYPCIAASLAAIFFGMRTFTLLDVLRHRFQ